METYSMSRKELGQAQDKLRTKTTPNKKVRNLTVELKIYLCLSLNNENCMKLGFLSPGYYIREVLEISVLRFRIQNY